MCGTIAATQGGSYRGGIELVTLTVTVTDSAGGYVKGLTEGDFIVLENGVPQPLAFFRPGPCRSMSPSCWTPAAAWPGPLPVVKAAAKGLVATLKEGDRAAVLSANRSVQIPQTFTTDRHAIDAAIDGVSARGPTAVYDALYIALKELARHRRAGTEVRRQVLIMLSDGLDNASHVSADDVAEAARRVSASVYAIALIAPDQVHVALPGGRALARAAFEMQALARDSGGRIFRPTSSLELPRIYGSIAMSWPTSTISPTSRAASTMAASDVSRCACRRRRGPAPARAADTTHRADRGARPASPARGRRNRDASLRRRSPASPACDAIQARESIPAAWERAYLQALES